MSIVCVVGHCINLPVYDSVQLWLLKHSLVFTGALIYRNIYGCALSCFVQTIKLKAGWLSTFIFVQQTSVRIINV